MRHLVITRPSVRSSVRSFGRPRVGRWSERAQQHACRNAMVASTALAEARRERDEVADYVAGTLARRAQAPAAAPFGGLPEGLSGS